jgi:hypothetical protein
MISDPLRRRATIIAGEVCRDDYCVVTKGRNDGRADVSRVRPNRDVGVVRSFRPCPQQGHKP